MLKAVLDTNVVVSAHLTADGPTALIFRLALSRYFQCYVREEILEEYCEVLQRRKFKLDAAYVVQFLFRNAHVSFDCCTREMDGGLRFRSHIIVTSKAIALNPALFGIR